MDKIWIIAKEVFRKNVKSWAFFWMIAGPIVMGLVIAGVGYFIYQDQLTSSVGDVAILSQNEEVVSTIKGLEDDNEYLFDLNQEQADQQLIDGEIDGYLLVEDQDDSFSAKFYRNNSGKNINTTNMEEALSDLNLQLNAEKLNLDQAKVAKLTDSKINIETIRMQSDDGEITQVSDDDPVMGAKIAVAYVVCFVVFIFIMNYVTIVSQEVAAEKGSRIMEIILSSVSAVHHFFGKLLGIAMVILTQLLIYGAIGMLFSYLGGLFMADFMMKNQGQFQGAEMEAGNMIDPALISDYVAAVRPVLLYGVLFAVLGIAIYSVIAAFLGSLVSRTEDVNKMITPITLMGVAGFYIALYALKSPNSSVVQVGSFIPLFTSFIMPFRIANDTVGTGEIWISVAVVVAFLILCVAVSVIFYKSNVLVYSEKGLIGTFKQSLAIWKNENKKK
ncbi:ABC transporter permease [Facklamia sp. DSM 111018]|uniref:ABC transporter permease n=1 Tax=Facklamia lactis TaxID=2749967 RepID=A0ABS0LR75_9LACT|nr:ABC transporter permease [Facklamia lactis]MBG9980163.1 ABC transporter permease [Facklamia lactis]MBG9985965.1 ABC transporter permease [Facklamia lactis]